MTAMISAHRCGAGLQEELENTLVALAAAVALDVDYIEFDVQRCADDEFLLFHDPYLDVEGVRHQLVDVPSTFVREHASQVMPYVTALEVLKAGGKRAHVDLKTMGERPVQGVPAAVAATMKAIEVLGAEAVLITTLEDARVREVRAWSQARHPDLLVGLSLGKEVSLRSPVTALLTRLSEVFPGRRLRRANANLVVAHKALAGLRVASWAARHRLPLLVWTVDEPSELEHWLTREDVFLVTTNHPTSALQVRRPAVRD